jgi:hypothetical protein
MVVVGMLSVYHVDFSIQSIIIRLTTIASAALKY